MNRARSRYGPNCHGLVKARSAGIAEQRFPTGICAKDAIGNDAGEPGGNDDLGLELGGTVQDFGGEHRPGQRGPEDRGDPRPHAGGHQHPPFGGPQVQQVAEQRAKARPDLGDGPFPASRAARSDGQGTGHDLDQRNPGADLALTKVVGGDHGIGPMALSLGRHREDEHAASQTAQRRDQHQEPGDQWMLRGGGPEIATGSPPDAARQRSPTTTPSA